MIPVTPERPPVVVTDPLAQYILDHADLDLCAPPTPRIVDQRCDGNLGEIMTFRSLHYLTLLFAGSGRNDFTVTEIARYAKGISRARIPTYLRGLCEKGLVDVVGHREIRGFTRENWAARYRIDHDRLRHESALVVVTDLRAANLPLPHGTVAPAPPERVVTVAAAPRAERLLPPPHVGRRSDMTLPSHDTPALVRLLAAPLPTADRWAGLRAALGTGLRGLTLRIAAAVTQRKGGVR
jgi:hypothetical protein